jgi:hypothetical protein
MNKPCSLSLHPLRHKANFRIDKIISLLLLDSTVRSIASQLNVSAYTVSSVRKTHNMAGQLRGGGRPAKLLPRHKTARLKFASEHKDWMKEDWKSVIWSDETIIHLNEPTSCCWAWKETNADIKDQHVQPTVKFGGGYLMLWGCMTARGVGYCCRLDDNMDAELYVQILNDKLRSTLKYYKYKAHEITFQQDNDLKYKPRMAQEWFKKHRINVLKWPSQSPDLNPIEHLWRHLKRLADYEEPPESIDELWERIQVEWAL